ncbi:hypothetical protein WICPIJ_008329 [Wickerhamomyces pijperi]|uniref:Uncharacterized protein n=1 Tax=Wickerhamomyces pijperi TaxID=599730 RepID=A0A9P8TIW7_WICPI|nr:hypothetical protein WICPIJ_008329 [Wickerhamomyces pijperi]
MEFLPWPFILFNLLPDPISQMFIVASSPAVANHLPSGDTAMVLMAPECPVKILTALPLAISHIRQVLSADPVNTYCELGWKVTVSTSFK